VPAAIALASLSPSPRRACTRRPPRACPACRTTPACPGPASAARADNPPELRRRPPAARHPTATDAAAARRPAPAHRSKTPARSPAQIHRHLVTEQAPRITRHPEPKTRRRPRRAIPRTVTDMVPARVPVPAVTAGVAFRAADLLGAPRRPQAARAGWLHQIDHLPHPGLPGGPPLARTGWRNPRQRTLAAAPETQDRFRRPCCRRFSGTSRASEATRNSRGMVGWAAAAAGGRPGTRGQRTAARSRHHGRPG
jgi:hypothetical protein